MSGRRGTGQSLHPCHGLGSYPLGYSPTLSWTRVNCQISWAAAQASRMLFSTTFQAEGFSFFLSLALWWSCFPCSCFPTPLSFFPQPSFLFFLSPSCAEQYRFRVLQTIFLWQDVEPNLNFNLFRAVASLTRGERGILKLPTVGGINYTALCKSITQRPPQ